MARRALLDSHRGYDPGALIMARALATAFKAPLVPPPSPSADRPQSLDRSSTAFFGGDARRAGGGARADRRAMLRSVSNRSRASRPEFGVARPARDPHIVAQLHFGVGRQGAKRRRRFLYDPHRRDEAELCARWKAALAVVAPTLRVRRNYPYAGKGDGVTSYLRRRFPRSAYAGIEVEINQDIVFAAGPRWTSLRRVLIDSLRMACGA